MTAISSLRRGGIGPSLVGSLPRLAKNVLARSIREVSCTRICNSQIGAIESTNDLFEFARIWMRRPSPQTRNSPGRDNFKQTNKARKTPAKPANKQFHCSLGLFEKLTRPKVNVSNVHELRHAILDQEYELSQIKLANQLDAAMKESAIESLKDNHDVLQLIKQRFLTGSIPGNRQDSASLALAIEGGGMRGCVSAGMAAAIASLGLTDTFDTIYGSSAGSVVGSYMVSRQMCMDVYLDILPAARTKFLCKPRIVGSFVKSFPKVLATGMLHNTSFPEYLRQNPGMNLSYVLDGIMGPENGIRSLDMLKFEENNRRQPLRVVASCVDEQSRMASKCFGSEDFFGESRVRRVDGLREGLFACLEASMNVPGVTGPPIELVSGHGSHTVKRTCFDAFCFEPIPYRSAVEEGATHVLALCSRPLGFQPKTKPSIFEKAIAPLYFYSHGHHNVGSYFERGGQLYICTEDILTLQDAKRRGSVPVLVPPPHVLYGLEEQSAHLQTLQRSRQWNQAHLFPVQLPPGTPTLNSLEQDKTKVLEAVRGGFSAAFDLLSPIVGLKSQLTCITGDEAAKLVFPDSYANTNTPHLDEIVLQTRVRVPGECISPFKKPPPSTQARPQPGTLQGVRTSNMSLSQELLALLPGFQGGNLSHLSRGLKAGSTIPIRD